MAILPANDLRRQGLENDWPLAQLISFKFRSPVDVVNITSWPADISATVNDSKVFGTGDRQITFESEPTMLLASREQAIAGQLGRDLFTFQGVDKAFLWSRRFKLGYLNVRIGVWWVFLDEVNNIWSPVLDIYRGKCLQPRYHTEQDIRLCTARFGGPLTQIESNNARRITDGNQRQRDIDDNAYEYVASVIDVKWGI